MSMPTAPAEATLVAPHGGVLVDRFVPKAEAEALRQRALGLPALVLDAARAGRPRADRGGRREPARRASWARPTTVASSSTCASRTGRCGRCPSPWP